MAGLILGVILIPQAMAYGLLAGVPPVYGLYAALVPLLIYTLLASTPHVSVGPTALASLLCLNGLSELAEPGTTDYLNLAILLAGLTGLLQVVFGLLRLGVLVNLLSRPVLSGFVSAAAVLIVVSQLRALLGIDAPRSGFLHRTLIDLWQNFDTLHLPTAALGLGSLLVLQLGYRYLPRWPSLLIWIVATTVLVATVGLDRRGIAVVGEVPAGLPSFEVATVNPNTLTELLPVALVLALISFVETLSIGKTFSTRHNYYRLMPNRELIALGAAKIGGAFFGAIPTSASFSRSAVVEQSGGKGPLSGVVAFLLLALVLLYFTSLFYFLPITVLAAVIIFSVRRLFDVAEMKRLYRLAPREFLTLIVTFCFTLFAGLQYGIAGGVVLSLAFGLLRAARPHLAELGRVPGTNAFRNLDRFAEAEVDNAVLIVRFDAELYFGNADYFRQRILDLAAKRNEYLRLVILDAHTINDLDSTGAFVLERLIEELALQEVEIYLCGVIGPVRDMLFHSGLMEKLGADHQFLSIQEALDCFHQGSDPRDWDRPAVQHD